MKQSRMKEYAKEDLVWEAVRRNENYKRYYYESLKKYPDKRTSKHEELEISPIDAYWKLSKLYDPQIDISEIREQIAKGKDPHKVHPYYSLYERRQLKQVIFHGVPGSKYYDYNAKSHYDFFKGDDKKILCIKKSKLVNRVVISFDPLLTDKELFYSIKRIKTNALRVRDAYASARKKRLKLIEAISGNTAKDPSGRDPKITFACYTRDIPAHLQRLKKYDEVINYCMTQKEKNPCSKEFSLIEKNGALIVTPEFAFKHMVPDAIQYGTKEYDTKRKGWQTYYEGAMELIKSAPNIVFTSSKKSSKKSV